MSKLKHLSVLWQAWWLAGTERVDSRLLICQLKLPLERCERRRLAFCAQSALVSLCALLVQTSALWKFVFDAAPSSAPLRATCPQSHEKCLIQKVTLSRLLLAAGCCFLRPDLLARSRLAASMLASCMAPRGSLTSKPLKRLSEPPPAYLSLSSSACLVAGGSQEPPCLPFSHRPLQENFI